MKFSRKVNKKIDDMDRKFYLIYLIVCGIVAPIFGWYLGQQPMVDEFIKNFF